MDLLQFVQFVIVFIIILAIITAISTIIVSLLINFKSLLNYQWNVDYFIRRDQLCDSQRWAALELETLRYNIAMFIHDNNSKYKQSIKQDYEKTYAIITTVLGILLAYYIIVFGFSIVVWLGYLKEKPIFNLGIWGFIVTIAFMITYTAVSSKCLKNFKDIEGDSNLRAYYNVYKIVNAAMVAGNMKNVELKYSHEGLDKSTLDQILEKNIASFEDIYVSSKVKMLKEEAYKKLDFLKYLTFEKYSAYYLPYFDHVYINRNMAESKFLEDLYKEYNSLDSLDKIKIFIPNAKSHIKSATQSTDPNIKSIETKYIDVINALLSEDDTDMDTIYKMYQSLKNYVNNMKSELAGKSSNVYNFLNYINHSDFQKYIDYIEINALIGSLLKDQNVTVDNSDYIKYYVENKDILTAPSKLEDIIDKSKKQATYVYSYFVYFAILFILISHVLFHNVPRSRYLYILGGVFLFCFLFVWIYTQMYFFA